LLLIFKQFLHNNLILRGIHMRFGVLIYVITWLFSTAALGKEKQPNIILFLVDDMGWQDTSVPFADYVTDNNKKFHTPNMERLADQGIKYTNAYACTVCSPSRVSIMSGMNVAHHGVTNYTGRKDRPTDGDNEKFTFPDWNYNGFQPQSMNHSVQFTALPSILKKEGYKTIHVGKGHFGTHGTEGANPLSLGFDVNIAGHAFGQPGSYYGKKNFARNPKKKGAWDVPDLEAYHGKDIFLTEALTIEANKEIKKAVDEDEPFFLYMAHYAIHTPIQPDPRYVQKYLEKGLDKKEAAYASLVEGMDASLGAIMDQIEELGIDNNTYIIFASDNGGLAAHSRGGEKHTQNAPLRSGKGSAYEGGIRIPLIVRLVSHDKASSVDDRMVQIEDLYPTILSFAGVNSISPFQDVDGINITGTKWRKVAYWHYPNEWGVGGPGIGASSTIRYKNWKLIYFYNDGHCELYDLDEDLGEKNNLADQENKISRKLLCKLTKYLNSINASFPHYHSGKEAKIKSLTYEGL
jgi:arylsulfatase A-like enzyme